MQWLIENKEWGVGILLAVVGIVAAIIQRNSDAKGKQSVTGNVTNIKIVNGNRQNGSQTSDTDQEKDGDNNIYSSKNNKQILFVDDDVTFKVVKILKRAGWVHTKIIKDIRSLNDEDVKNADLFFIDIQGVGKSLSFPDEGLGLARALKQKYPEKKLVIYSAEADGDRFHEAFRLADDQLKKTADPYEFQKVVEEMLGE